MRPGFRAGVPPDGWFDEVERWLLEDLGDLRTMRAALRAHLAATSPDSLQEGLPDRLLLVANELASNALRHGRGQAVVVLGRGDAGWLLDVMDLAVDRDPTPAVDRTPGEGGYGLYLVAELAASMGWYHDGEHKHVWGHVLAPSPQNMVV